jgi:hypothetical protein
MRRLILAALLALAPTTAEAAVTFFFHGTTDPFGSYALTFNGTSDITYDSPSGGTFDVDGSITIDTAAIGANHAVTPNALEYDGEGSPFLSATFTSTGTTPVLLSSGDFQHLISSDPDNGGFTLQISWQAANGNTSSFLLGGTVVPTGDFGGFQLPDLDKATDLYFSVTSHQLTRDGYIELNSSGPLAAAAPVPEPASWALMIFGFGAVGGSLRLRRSMVAAAA